MAIKVSTQYLFTTLLSLSLLLLFFGCSTSFADDVNNGRTTSSNRKILAATKFDFTPFLHHHHNHHRWHRPRHVPADNIRRPEPSGNEIDPRYGVEKRLVPTGPNPLHH
ncbi:hypothetical protein J1N35_020266 [Gossypium stocksii]|uniref:Uncharacterized protein n=1 Tax=Gossypium stocksii TaxID=47602 RepID=A0A9D3VCN2_9ROSI|nr:hypothetical protein J1N35_020266 [Gossypium stocksii]